MFNLLLKGSNPEGHFGGGIEGDSHVPIETENLPFITISAGSRFAFGITEEGDLYASGANESGQLGFPSNSVNKFTKVTCLKHKVKQVACGWNHSILLTEDGQVFVSGDGKKGQLGLNSEKLSSNLFIKLDSIKEKVVQVACGIWSSFAVLNSGRVLFWGQFKTLQNETVWTPTFLQNIENVVKISVGHKHFLMLSSDGKVSGYGCNKYGQIALEEYDSGIVCDIFAGWNHSILLLKSNELILLGKNDHNQLAHPDKSCHKNILTFEDEDIQDLSVGSDHAMLLTNKRLLIWGWNEHGILGQNHTEQLFGAPQELNFDINGIKKIICGPVSCFIIK